MTKNLRRDERVAFGGRCSDYSGMKEREMTDIGRLISEALLNSKQKGVLEEIGEETRSIAK